MIIVGNNADARPEKRQVSTEEGKQLARRLGVAFIETSARTGKNVDEAFLGAIAEIERCNVNFGSEPSQTRCQVM